MPARRRWTRNVLTNAGAISEDQRRSLLDYIRDLEFERRIPGFRAQPISRRPATPTQEDAHDAMMKAGKNGVLALIGELAKERDAQVRIAEHRVVKVKESCERLGMEPPRDVIESYANILRQRQPSVPSVFR